VSSVSSIVLEHAPQQAPADAGCSLEAALACQARHRSRERGGTTFRKEHRIDIPTQGVPDQVEGEWEGHGCHLQLCFLLPVACRAMTVEADGIAKVSCLLMRVVTGCFQWALRH
jgi:hypothetical protein